MVWLVVRWLPQLAGKLHVPRPPPRRLFAVYSCVPGMCASVVKLSFVCLPTWKTLGFVKFMQMSFRQLAINVCTGHSRSQFPIFVCVLVHPCGCVLFRVYVVAICGPLVIQIMWSTFTAGPQMPLTCPFSENHPPRRQKLADRSVLRSMCKLLYIIFPPAYWGL